MSGNSVVIHDFDSFRARIGPLEAESELVFDADAVLDRAVAAQRLQAVARWHPQIVQSLSNLGLVLTPWGLGKFWPTIFFQALKPLNCSLSTFGQAFRND